MLKDTSKVLERLYDKINGDLIVISECKDLIEKEFSHNINEYEESDFNYLAESLIVVASDLFTLKEVLNIDEEIINKELLDEYNLSYNLIQNFHLKLELKNYQLKEIKTSIK